LSTFRILAALSADDSANTLSWSWLIDLDSVYIYENSQ
jgi:hypothetical protein